MNESDVWMIRPTCPALAHRKSPLWVLVAALALLSVYEKSTLTFDVQSASDRPSFELTSEK